MNPGPRSQERFFRALSELLPVDRVTHVHLVHQDPQQPSPIPMLRSRGFKGCVVAARASIAQSATYWPDLQWVLHDHPTAEQPADHCLLELPQGREASRFTIDKALNAISPTGQLWIYGIREHGILSLAKKYPPAQVALVKGHMRLLSLSRQDATPRDDTTQDPYFRLRYGGITFATLPGVFSWQEPDEGSLMLLEAMLEQDPGDRVLDWGCGYGLLGITLARRWPQAQLVLADDQYAAVRATRETLQCNQLEGHITVLLEDGIGPGLSRTTFSTIVTNPPFHRGARNDQEPALAFFKQVGSLLQPHGNLWLVGNQFLAHRRTLQQLGFECEIVLENNRFEVCRAWKKSRFKQTTTPRLRLTP
ncbi:MAG: class I SAM-dependent methyltransferase [Magnetococcales bacterium]|nr:class I SAM-dependent methyltransferase [Magnetococcales bacterium]